MRFGVALLVVVAAGCHSGAAGAHSVRPARDHCGRVTFAAGAGWRTRSTTASGLRIGQATTARFHESAGEFPDSSLRDLPPDGILVYAADYGREPRNLPHPRRPPYNLAGFRHDRGWEGQPKVSVPQYVLFTSLRGHLLDVRVFFGRQDPGSRPVRRAQAELDSLRWGLCA